MSPAELAKTVRWMLYRVQSAEGYEEALAALAELERLAERGQHA